MKKIFRSFFYNKEDINYIAILVPINEFYYYYKVNEPRLSLIRFSYKSEFEDLHSFYNFISNEDIIKYSNYYKDL